jgi:eukaryotic-like serine/threonine-protein kinase
MIVVDDVGTLGSGGRSDVRRGRRRDNGESVAVKLLREANLPSERLGFAFEVSLLKQRLPGMIPVLAANVHAQKPCYIMPLMRGGPLATHAGKLTPLQIWSVVDFLTSTLSGLHSRGYFHGDLKPDNILLDEHGKLACSDPSARGGTPGYWAPEVRSGGSISPASDVYSLGATLFHLVTGRRPEDDSSLDIFPYAPGELDLRNLVFSCCKPDPHFRPTASQIIDWRSQTAKGVSDDIKRLLVAGGMIWLIAELFG